MRIFTDFHSFDRSLKTISVSDGIICGINKNPIDFPYAETVSLGGRFLVPGFIDSHTHFLHTALEDGYADLSSAMDPFEAASILKESGRQRGRGYDSSKGVLSKRHLDYVSENEPVFAVMMDYHSISCNSEALKMLDVPLHIRNSDTADGVFREKAYMWISERLSEINTDEDRELAFRTAEKKAFSQGVVSVHALEGGKGWGMEDADFMLKKEMNPDGGIGITLYPQTVDISWAKERNLKRIGGCLLIDGTIGNRTAALIEPYCDSDTFGELYFSESALLSFVERAFREGMQTAFHAIGDRASMLVASVYSKALKRNPGVYRPRIEHCEVFSEDVCRICSENSILVAVQPVFERIWGKSMYRSRLENRRTNCYRTMLDNGIRLAGGSDYGVTEISPLKGIAAAVKREDGEGISIDEAFRMFSSDAAYFSFEENKKGSVRIGALGDFAVLSEEPSYVNIDDIFVLKTFKSGELKFSSDSSCIK